MEFRRAHGTCAYAASSALVDDAPACGMIGFVPILTGPVVPAGRIRSLPQPTLHAGAR